MTKMKQIVLRVSFASGGDRMAVNAGEKSGLDSRTYDYFYVTREGEEVKTGMHAIVDGAGQGMTVVYIRQVLSRSVKASSHALAVFSLEGYRERMDKLERIESLKAEILERAEAAKEREKLLALASNDEGLAALLTELDELQGS